MKTTVQNGDIRELIQAMAQLADRDLPVATSFAIARGLRAARAQLELYEEARMGLIEKYGTKDDKGEFIKEKDNPSAVDVKPEFWNEMRELDKQTDAQFDTIALDSFADVSPRILMGLMPILEDETTEK